MSTTCEQDVWYSLPEDESAAGIAAPETHCKVGVGPVDIGRRRRPFLRGVVDLRAGDTPQASGHDEVTDAHLPREEPPDAPAGFLRGASGCGLGSRGPGVPHQQRVQQGAESFSDNGGREPPFALDALDKKLSGAWMGKRSGRRDEMMTSGRGLSSYSLVFRTSNAAVSVLMGNCETTAMIE